MDAKLGAIKIVKTLTRAGYIAYFAGGWVRDYIMKHPSDDIDIATDAPPEAIMQLFPHTILVGLAFGVIVVILDGHQYELATFRKDLNYVGGRRPESIELSSPQEDASRRDFTINGMFYDPLTDVIHDYVGGREDIERGILRTIGDPHERFLEDRLRMIRAVRFASRFGFQIDPETQLAIKKHASTLFPSVAMERIWQEFNKMAKFPRFDQALLDMQRLDLLPVIFPALANMHLSDLEARVAVFNQFPKGAPVILYVTELFPDTPLNDLLELCQYLKTSVHEGKLVEFAYKGRHLLMQEEREPYAIEGHQWAHFYANRFFRVCFDVMTARFPEHQRTALLEKHHKRRERLLPHIQRLVDRKPLVTAAVLQDHGVLPGKEMGKLLKEAETIAISRDIHDPETVISLLKDTVLWPKK
jgi:poly(A) polymerase